MIKSTDIPHTLNAQELAGLKRLINTVRYLRSPEGCSWDQQQSLMSLREDLIDEVYELLAEIHSMALEPNNTGLHPLLRDEFGDVLLVVMMMIAIYEETQTESFSSILHEEYHKLIRRHPHVFSDSQSHDIAKNLKKQFLLSTHEDKQDAKKLVSQWQDIKSKVEQRPEPVLEDYKKSLPPLERALAIQKLVSKKGLDEDLKSYEMKVLEELNELLQVYKNEPHNTALLEEEFGDALFSLINVGRKLGLNPSGGLLRAISKFNSRACYVVEQLEKNDNTLSPEQLWKHIKEIENKKKLTSTHR